MKWCAAIGMMLLLGSAQALELTGVQGVAEVFGGAWTPAKPGLVQGRVRTLVGRAILSEGTGRLTLGSRSSLELRDGKPALLAGQAYLEGPLLGFVGDYHFRLEAGSRARIDLVGPLARFALLSGRANLFSSQTRRTSSLNTFQSFALRTARVSGFSEEPRPWYQEQFQTLGAMALEASRGTVEVQSSGAWSPLRKGQGLSGEGAVRTGAASWAELGFEGGGYLRLGEKALLRVLGLEQLSSGKRRVILALEQGSAWNVVEKGKGGYELRTATLVAGVRGTVFRLDADGLLKVLEGQVSAATPAGEQPVSRGQQVEQGQKEALKLDALDRFNLERDRLRAAPLRLEGGLPAPAVLREVLLALETNPDSEVSLSWAGQRVALSPDSAGGVRFRPALPEGELELTLSVAHYADSRAQTVRYQIDRSAPRIESLGLRREGEQGVLRLKVSDASRLSLGLQDAAGQAVPFSGTLEQGEVRFAWTAGLLDLILSDAAGNRTVQRLDLDLPF